MGTVVLSPQDCIPSSHHRRNQQAQAMSQYSTFRVADSKTSHGLIPERRRPDPTTVPPSAKGILPCPFPSGQVRPNSRHTNVHALSSFSGKESSSAFMPSKNSVVSSHSYTPQRQKLFASLVCSSHSLGSYTASQTNPGMPCSRSPFKVVQDNNFEGLLTSERNFMHKRKLSNSNFMHQRRKISNENLDHSNNKSMRRYHGNHYDSSKGVHKSKQVKSTMSSCLPLSEKDNEKKKKFPDVVRILQRPNDDETAAQLMARLFCNTEIQNTQVLPSASSSSLADEEKLAGDTKSGPLFEDVNQGCSSSPGVKVVEEQSDVNTNTSDSFVDNSSPWSDPCTWERWAGPSYINSPPPSALPIPRFSKTNDVCSGSMFTDLKIPTKSVRAISSLTQSDTVREAIDVATKNLKRILNLDICR